MSGLLRLNRSVQQSGDLQRFRKCVYAAITAILVVRRGTLSVEAHRYQVHMMWLCCSNGSNAAVKQLLLSVLPKGDWRVWEDVDYIMDESGTADTSDPEVIASMVASGLTYVFVSSRLKVFKRQRWQGADLAMDETGPMAAVNGILEHSYERCIASFRKGGHAAF